MTLKERAIEVLNMPDTENRGKQLFAIHNEIFPNQKEKHSYCYGCRKRVETKLRNYVNSN